MLSDFGEETINKLGCGEDAGDLESTLHGVIVTAQSHAV